MHSTLLLLLVTLMTQGATASLALAPCKASDPTQLFSYDATNQHITLAKDSSQCLMIATGCCDGELIRAGSFLNVDACATAFESQKLSWPSSSTGWLLRPTSTAGEPTVSTLPGNATLVFNARGYFFSGAVLLGGALDNTTSFFHATADGHIVNNATGLCVSTNMPAALVGQPLNLQSCSVAKQQPTTGTSSSTQLFFIDPMLSHIVTSEQLCLTAERPLDAAAGGQARLISATCADVTIASQAINLTAAGRLVAFELPGMPVSDAGVATWWGARVPLTTGSAASSTSVFSWTPSTTNASLGSLTHTATGMCLDSGGVPAGHGCIDPYVRGLPFCDSTLSFDARLADLVNRLTIEEATSLLGDAGDTTIPCTTNTAAIPRLDITPYRWLVEVSSMAGSKGTCSPLVPFGGGCPTSFPAAMLLTGAFNRTLWHLHGQVVGDEMRALSNFATTSLNADAGAIPSLAGHGPNINQPRDPRNGRNGELSSEDPLLSGAFATAYVIGMQFGTDGALAVNTTTRRMLASLKHYNAYSRETDRMGSQGNVSIFDLWDTYLPQFATPMQNALAAGTMCSYFSMAIEGAPGPLSYIPSCADPYILTTVVREYWARPDATHLSDCGAVINMVNPHPKGNGFVSLNNFSGAAAVSVNAGMDQNSNTISPSHMSAALAEKLTTETIVRAAAARVLAQRLRLGHFDALEVTPSSLLSLGPTDVGTAAARATADEGVRQGVTLLRNIDGVLPLRRGSRIAVVGPTSLSVTAAIGDIYGPSSAICPDDSDSCWPLIGPAISDANVGGTTNVVLGVQMLKNDSSWAAALAAVDGVDVVILTLGTDRTVAGEGSDRKDIGLPGVQSSFALAVLERAAAATPPIPVVLLFVHNLPVSFDELLVPARSGFAPPSAIVDTWAYTSHGAQLAELLFGGVNGFGRATLTVYPHAYQDTVDLFDMSMTPRSASAVTSASAGRSYRFYDGSVGAPLVRFGEGLSGFSTFDLSCASDASSISAGNAVTLSCNVTHLTGPAGDEVLMVFHRPGADIIAAVGDTHPLPLSALRDFERIAVSSTGNNAAAVPVTFNINANSSLCFTNQVGAQILYAGTHYLDIWNGNSNNITIAITVTTPGDSPLVINAPPLPW